MTEQANPTITSKSLPPSQQPGAVTSSPAVPPPQPDLTYDQIVAKPLRAPNFLNLKPKNPSMSLYWGNRAVGDDESHLRYDQLISMGFQPAKPEMVLTMDGKPCPPSIQRDGRIMYGDLILLIMPRTDYVGALKYNAQSAEMRVRRFGSAKTEGDGTNVESALGAVTQSRAAREGKIKPYIPPLVETEALTADNSDIKPTIAK